MDPIVFLEVIAVAIGAVVGLGGLAATIWAIGKVRGVETSIELLNAANDGLRLANEDLRAEHRRTEAECAKAIARLEGQNQALLDGLGDKLAEAIAARLEHSLQRVADSVVDGVAQRAADRERRFRDGALPE